MKFILSRNEDYRSRSKKWMVGYALLFWLISRIIVVALMGVCMFAYEKHGINPRELTSFGGDPAVALSSRGLLRALLMTALIAPLFEELLFRFGLSFRRVSVGVSLACLALFPAFSHSKTDTPMFWIISCCIAAAVFCCIFFATKDEFWRKMKARWQIPAIWVSSIAFGLAHLCAFSALSWTLLPYALVTSLAPFFAGCSCAYLRVNLGFGWGLAMHIFNNLPGIVLMLCV
ncbi:MAG: CPBP family glutamic-type intramembrane protease [Clostridium sp.]|nr:CPBP family glutamic-type intramembrane protease [Clostridium sp.]